MSRKNLFTIVGALAAVSMLLAACGPAATAAPTSAPAAPATAAPTAVPPTTRHGGWLDEIDFSVVAKDSAITQLQAGAIDIYAGGLSSGDFAAIDAAKLSYGESNGLYYDIMYNPAVFKDATVLNPFSNRKIREATNWLYDRNYINQEIYAGGALAKFFPIQTNGPEYVDLIDTARALEAKYAYNPEKAKSVINTEMTGMGATLGTDGKWQFGGKPVSLLFLIRPDSDGTRKPAGDYVANQLEAAGFTVDRQYKKSSEASPIWVGSDPADGLWNLYTAAWSSSAISRDERDMWQQMHLNTSVQGMPVFLANAADPAFQKVGDDLAQANFKDAAERHDLMVQAMSLGLEDSLQLWLIDGKNRSPYVPTVKATADLAAGIEGSVAANQTVRFIGKEGGTMKWGEPDQFAEPWNPVAGSNWTFDHAAYDKTVSGSTSGNMPDPFSGLLWPLRSEKAEITVLSSLPVEKTLDWVTLTKADSITVPADAWVDWDAKTQKFITAAESGKTGDALTAKVKSVVYYPANMFSTVKWHNGTALSPADFVMGMIMTFDRAKPDSGIYDSSYADGYYSSFISTFKGMKIVSTDPMVVEYYSDSWARDAELNTSSLWPNYGYGEGNWAVMALSNASEAAGTNAYSADKADANQVEETNFIGGPSLENMSKALTEAAAAGTIPYAATMGAYLTADQAKAAYANVEAWYKAHGHFWIGTGPYYLDKVDLTGKTLVLKNNPDYADLSDRWDQFGSPKMAEAMVEGDAQVKIGGDATFTVSVTTGGAPYPQAEIKKVAYLIYDATGTVVAKGEATAVADGQYEVKLGMDVTGKLAAGSDKIEVAVVPLYVSVPAFATFEFVTAP